ncbi:MAG: hypothetical protein NVSMB13_07740 [Mycobacteriales bacterium]
MTNDDTSELGLLPIDAEAASRGYDSGFDIVPFRGYHRGQVDDHIHRLESALHQSEDARGSAEARARTAEEQASALRSELADASARLGRVTPTYADLGEHVAVLLSHAEQVAAEVRANAEIEANQLRHSVTQELAEATNQRDTARAGLAAELQAQRSAAEAELATARTAAEDEAKRIVEQARTEAEQTQAAAARQLEELTAQRDEIRAQLRRLREQLAAAVSGMTDAGTPPDKAAQAEPPDPGAGHQPRP